jgi:hypothetical protein
MMFFLSPFAYYELKRLGVRALQKEWAVGIWSTVTGWLALVGVGVLKVLGPGDYDVRDLSKVVVAGCSVALAWFFIVWLGVEAFQRLRARLRR